MSLVRFDPSTVTVKQSFIVSQIVSLRNGQHTQPPYEMTRVQTFHSSSSAEHKPYSVYIIISLKILGEENLSLSQELYGVQSPPKINLTTQHST